MPRALEAEPAARPAPPGPSRPQTAGEQRVPLCNRASGSQPSRGGRSPGPESAERCGPPAAPRPSRPLGSRQRV